MLGLYRGKIAGAPPLFPAQMEARITSYLAGGAPALVVEKAASWAATGALRELASPAESDWLLHNASFPSPPH
jgi:hypothetical protein